MVEPKCEVPTGCRKYKVRNLEYLIATLNWGLKGIHARAQEWNRPSVLKTEMPRKHQGMMTQRICEVTLSKAGW